MRHGWMIGMVLAVVACGDDVTLGEVDSRRGYLVTDCPWQAFPSVPDVGAGCFLDLFWSDVPPSDAVCAGEPFSSACLIDDIPDRDQRVLIAGWWEQTKICRLARKGEPRACASGDLFVVKRVIPE